MWGAPELIHDLDLASHFEALVDQRPGRLPEAEPRASSEHALEVMSVAPEKAMHVGDSYKADVEGARRLGITRAC